MAPTTFRLVTPRPFLFKAFLWAFVCCGFYVTDNGPWGDGAASAQMILAETPLSTASDSFFERNGVGFNFSLPGSGSVVGIGPDGQPTPNGAINFSFGGANNVIPAFGGFDPNSGAQFGFGSRGSNGGGFGLNFALGQGNNRTFTHTNPMIMLPNGGNGSIFSGSQRPFVTSFVPVVGEENLAPARELDAEPRRRAAERRSDSTADSRPSAPASSATTGDMSVAEIKRRKSAKREKALEKSLADARQAEEDGKLAMAKSYYRKAARQAQGERRAAILDELERLIREE